MDTTVSVSKRDQRLGDPYDPSMWPRPCVQCGIVKQARQFGWNGDDGWYTMCPKCRQTRIVRELYVEQERQVSLAVKKLVSAALKKPAPLPDMAEICRDVVAACGGQEEFVNRWAQSIMDTKSGSKTSIDAHRGLASTIQATAAQQSRDLELSQITPEQLESAILGFMEKMAGGDMVEALEHQDVVDDGD